MGKNNTPKKKKPQAGVKFSSQSFKHVSNDSFKGDTPRAHKFASKSFRYVNEMSSQDDDDPDTVTFIELSQELKEEGNRFFQRRDHCGALLSYQKALKLLSENHEDIATLRTNMAACYMQMGVNEYPRAINECSLALQVVPRYSKALLKRARCYMDLDRFDLALMDIDNVLEYEPDNIIALDLRDSLINEIVQLEAEIDDEEADVKKKKKSRKKKKKNTKVDREGEVAENGEVIVVKKDETEIDMRTVQVEDQRTETSGMVAEEKNVEKLVMNEYAKDKTRQTINEDSMAEKRPTMNEEKKSQLRRFVKDETKSEIKEEMNNEKKVDIRTIVNDAKKAETRMLKLVCGDDIRRAVLPLHSNIFMLKDKVKNRFRTLKGVIIKYKDHEGDLITITTTEDLRMAETYIDPTGCLRLYITGVDFDDEPIYEDEPEEEEMGKLEQNISKQIVVSGVVVEESLESEELETSSDSEDEDHWIGQFVRLLKNHVGFDSDSNMDLHEAGMKLYSDAMEQTVTSDEAHKLLENAAGKFQEMAALAAFNWANVYMTKAKKKVTISEDDSRESVLEQARVAFEWAQHQYENARVKYELAVKIKPNFYEGFIALGYQLFEQAKLTWYYALACDLEMESGPSSEILDLYNKAEESMEKGVLIWEEMERPNAHRRPEADRLGRNGHLRTVSTDEFADPASIMRSQIYVLWGALLYERSVVEYKMGIPVWAECLEVAVEKFEIAGASQTDIAVMVKNHCSNVNALEGLEFKIDEIVQAWNEMHDAKRWQFCEPSFRLEPLFRRQGPKLLSILEHIGCSLIED